MTTARSLGDVMRAAVEQGRQARLANEAAGRVYLEPPPECGRCKGSRYVTPQRGANIDPVPCPNCGEVAIEDRLRRAGLDGAATFDDWQLSAKMQPLVLACREILTGDRWVVFMRAGIGSGKTMLARATGVEFVRAGGSVAFWVVTDLLDAIRNTYERNNSEQAQYEFVRDRVHKPDLLILDDLGAHKPTTWATAMLFEIVNGRYNARQSKRLIVTSNVGRDEDDGELIDERVLSRIAPGEVVVEGAPDRRGEFER